MWRWIVALLLVALQPNVRPVFAQTTPTIESIDVNIWPEFDRVGVLIIYQITLSPTVPLPASVSFRIPISVNTPIRLLVRDRDGLLYNLPYTSEMQGDWIQIRFTAPRRLLQLEYSDPDLKVNDQKREFKYVWPGDYPVKQMILHVLRPLHATQITFMPGMGPGDLDSDGNEIFSRIVGQVPAGVTVTLNTIYEKWDSALLASTPMPVYPAEPVTPRTAGRLSRDIIGWLLGILGGLLIAGGVIWFWRSGRALPDMRRIHNDVAVKKESKPQPERPEEAIYCRQCGRRASHGDAFCRTCGTKLN